LKIAIRKNEPIGFDDAVLSGGLRTAHSSWMNHGSDPLVVAVAAAGMAMIIAAQWWFLRRKDSRDDEPE
jgi:hypothetical protein